ncbi:MAG: heat-inducible transcriptional repressor HrcA [Salana multivorans]|nr:heat-inducible transcriptional repressor HrcA [Salana multivorans]
MSTKNRRLDVLRAIVSDYVSTQEPVGSRALVERHALGVSPATIRNDMAALEQEGYIAQPHTSAGRIPTDAGYRLFVDHLAALKALSPAERRAIETFLFEAVDLDDAVERTVRLLAQLTQQAAVVQYPSLRRSALRHLEVVPLANGRVMTVIITDSGRVEQRTVTLPDGAAAPDEAEVADLRVRFNVAAAGRRMPELGLSLRAVPDVVAPGVAELARQIAEVVVETLTEEVEDRLVMAGHSHLTRSPLDFYHGLQPVLEALEEQVVLMNLLADVASEGEAGGDVTVRIGAENGYSPLAHASLVAAPYGREGTGDALAYLGVLGPTRVDYPGTMAAVRAVARYLSRFVSPLE